MPKEVISFISLLSRRLLLLQWTVHCPSVPPSLSQWLKDTAFILKLEKLNIQQEETLPGIFFFFL